MPPGHLPFIPVNQVPTTPQMAEALFNNTTGGYNIGMGYQAGEYNIPSADNQIAIGNTTGTGGAKQSNYWQQQPNLDWRAGGLVGYQRCQNKGTGADRCSRSEFY